MAAPKLYHWRRVRNFGDELSAWIMARLNVAYDAAEPRDANLVICGSVLEHLHPGWVGTVCGAGLLRETSTADLSLARVVALRGKLTAARTRGLPKQPVLGDPGLLVSRWAPQIVAKHDLGVVPHWSDDSLASRFPYGLLIDPRRAPGDVIRDIGACKRVVSSSLHGLIVADSFGIPRRAELFPDAGKPYEGGDFKYRDYASIYDTHPHWGEFWRAPYTVVEAVKNRLRDALAEATNTPVPRIDITPPPDVPPRTRGRRPLLSLLVPFHHDHTDSEHRARVWAWLARHWHAQLPDAEILIGHCPTLPYSKCRAVNEAAGRARGKVLCILDADAYPDAKVIRRCAADIIAATTAGRRLWHVPYRRLYRLSRDYTETLLETDPTRPYAMPSPPNGAWLEPDSRNTVAHGYLYGAMCMIMPTEAFFTAGGMDPRMAGWGGEDISFLRSLDTLYGLHEVVDADICHLWHLRPGKDWKTRTWQGQAAGLANSRLAQRYAAATGEPGFMRQLVAEYAQPAPLSMEYLRPARTSQAGARRKRAPSP